MAVTLAQFFVSAVVIVAAGVFLTRAAESLASLTGLGRLVVGTILLAGATSLPELLVGLSAVRLGAADLAAGDLFGATLYNLLLLAALDLTHRSHGRMFSREAAAHALSGAMSITLIVLAATGIVLGQQSRTPVVAGAGVSTWGILVAYALGVRLVFLDQRISARAASATGVDADVQVSVRSGDRRRATAWAALRFAVAAAAVAVAAPFLTTAAGDLAASTGLGQTFVGTTLVAACTTLPEAVVTLSAVRCGSLDLAIGNVLGSNAFNMVLLFPLDLAESGSLLAAVSSAHVLTCLAGILVTALTVMGQLYRVEKRRFFVEPDAALVIALVLGALALVYAVR